jgi:hypothetical protein
MNVDALLLFSASLLAKIQVADIFSTLCEGKQYSVCRPNSEIKITFPKLSLRTRIRNLLQINNSIFVSASSNTCNRIKYAVSI